IQVDRDGSHLGRRHPVNLGVVGDIAPTLDALLPPPALPCATPGLCRIRPAAPCTGPDPAGTAVDPGLASSLPGAWQARQAALH
ncbi:hypothetical protein, partial [Stenotrophomonas sp. 3diitr2024]|uniref:hypothetical protein n=1 Tax=Stenotrophomonas sp. 3diitr2024 TaxID=3345115 RepID=UPI0035CBF24D